VLQSAIESICVEIVGFLVMLRGTAKGLLLFPKLLLPRPGLLKLPRDLSLVLRSEEANKLFSAGLEYRLWDATLLLGETERLDCIF
jgi:hypothetical protein